MTQTLKAHLLADLKPTTGNFAGYAYQPDLSNISSPDKETVKRMAAVACGLSMVACPVSPSSHTSYMGELVCAPVPSATSTGSHLSTLRIL